MKALSVNAQEFVPTGWFNQHQQPLKRQHNFLVNFCWNTWVGTPVFWDSNEL